MSVCVIFISKLSTTTKSQNKISRENPGKSKFKELHNKYDKLKVIDSASILPRNKNIMYYL